MTKTKKLLALLLAVCMVLGLLPAVAMADTVRVTDTLTYSNTTSSSSYTQWTSDKTKDDINSNAVYAGYSMKGNGNSIQLNSKNNYGIVTTASGGKVKSITIAVASGTKTLDIYGKNTAYSSTADLYNSSSQGTKLGSLSANGTVTVTEDYEYVGLRSNSGAIYLTSIEIVWETEGNGGDDPQPQTYTVTFDYNDGGLTANTTATTGTDGKLTSLPEPTWTDHNFLGWFTAATGGDQITTDTVFTADTTVYAHWEDTTPAPAGDTYTYQLVTDVSALEAGNKLLIVSAGEAGSGYALSRNKGNNRGAASVTIDSNLKIETEIAASNDDTTKPFELTLGGSTGSWTLYDSVNSGYLYAAGGTDSNYLKVDTGSAPADTGKWTIEIDSSNEATIKAIDASTTRNWLRYNDSNSTNLLFSCYSNGQKAVYIYKLVENGEQPVTNYTVSFNANGGSGEMASVTKAENAVYTLPACGFTAQEGYRFTGWKVGNTGNLLAAEVDTITITGDVELFAQWEPIPTYVVSFDPNGGTGNMANVTTTSPYTLPACGFNAPEGKAFDYWAVDGDDTHYAPGDSYTLTANTTFVAQWKDAPATTAATLAAALPDSGKVVIFNPAYGKALDACGTSGFYNAGVDCTPVNYVINATDNILWDVTKVSEGVYKFSQDGHYLSMGASYGSTPYDDINQEWQVAPYGDGYSIMNTGRNCYLEWYDSKNYFSGYATISNNGMFTFQFYVVGGEAPATYTVTFDANGGSGTMADVTDVTSPYELPACTFTAPAGKAFAGWTVDGGDGTVYQPGDSYVIAEDTTFLATWTGDTRTYQLVTNEGQLVAGGKYIMVGVDDSGAHALSSMSGNGIYRNIFDVTVDNGKILLANSDVAAAATDTNVYELTLGGNASGGWTFHDGFSGYLCATSSGSNNIGVQTDVDENGMFNVMIDTDGMVHATAKGTYTRNQILYNFSSPRFSCYEKPSANYTKYFYLYKLVDPLPDGYYLVGSMTNWQPDPMQQFTVNPANGAEFMLNTTLAVNDEIKVVGVQNGVQTWYPGGENNNYLIGEVNAGTVTVYFRPDGQGGEGWHYGCIYIADFDLFKTQNLVLSELIGVQFFLDLSVLSPEEKAGSYMTFSITGRGKNDLKTTRVDFADASTNSKGYRGFLCKVNALQMADTITATFHYGDGLTATKDYSVKNYVDKWAELYPSDTSSTTELIHYLADYGYHAQKFLASVNHFEICEDENDADKESKYMQMDTHYSTLENYNVDAIGEASIENTPMTVSGDNTVFGNPTMALKLDSETAIRVYFKTNDGSALDDSFTVTVTKDGAADPLTLGEDYTVTKEGNRYKVEITGVKASELLTKYTIEASNGEGAETQTVCVSAASYVGRLLSSEAYKGNDLAKAAVCALWNYAQAAANYND